MGRIYATSIVVGDLMGHWRVVERAANQQQHSTYWFVRCEVCEYFRIIGDRALKETPGIVRCVCNTKNFKRLAHGLEGTVASRLWTAAHHRAKVQKLPFTIRPSDIRVPEYCPLLGTRLRADHKGYGRPDSPSLDQIIAGRGYTPRNIMVISLRANTIKSNATIEELKRLVQALAPIYYGVL